jgi:nucleotide-binding universal stress UspA family protein
MHTILVATDFSPASEEAAMFAASLASQIGASLHLAHIYQLPVNISETPMLIVSSDEIHHNVDLHMSRAAETVKKNFPGIDIKTESRLGAITDELNEICSKLKPVFVVAGYEGHKGIEDIFFGQTALSILRHSRLPVLVVPGGVLNNPLKKIAFATDLTHEDQIPFEKIKNITSLLGASLSIVHVLTDEKKETGALSAIASKLGAEPHIISNGNFVDGMLQFSRQHQTDLMMVIPHKHNLFERMFSKQHTGELVEKIHTPVLALPE